MRQFTEFSLTESFRHASYVVLFAGIKTGRCVNATHPKTKEATTVCEVKAWCPVEVDIRPL